MKKLQIPIILSIIALVTILSQCTKDKPDDNVCTTCPPSKVGTPYDFVIPDKFPQPYIPADNPLTVEGVDLGRHLFYDKRLSSDMSMACASCHHQDFGFSDLPANKTSLGVVGASGRRNAMALFNLAWQEFFFWDGRALSLEEQSLHPIKDPLELNIDLPTVIARLENDSVYPQMFKAAFGDNEINEDRMAKAIAQFERTIISASSRFDSIQRLGMGSFTPQEQEGFNMFTSDFTPNGLQGGDCFHCHGAKETGFLMGAFGRDLQFANNGLKESYPNDKGRMEVTGNAFDEGKFKIPSVRNVAFTFPYMHDGSIPTLDSLIDFYNTGGHANSPNLDPNMKAAGKGRNWTQNQQEALKAFLLTLTDNKFRSNPAYSNPFQQ